jgi:hypothetical protein
MAVVTATFQKCGSGSLKVGRPWKTGGCESCRKPCSQTPTYDIPATAGKQATAAMLATAMIPAATGTPALHQQQNASNSRICEEKYIVAGNKPKMRL